MLSPVAELKVLAPPGDKYARPGVVFHTQPRLRVLSEDGTPLAALTVIAFAWHTPYFFNVSCMAVPGVPCSNTLSHHMRGQNYAQFEPSTASVITDTEGVASFTNLTVRSASSKYLYVFFYCGGVVAPWNDPSLQPKPPFLPRPPKYVRPIYIDGSVRTIQPLGSCHFYTEWSKTATFRRKIFSSAPAGSGDYSAPLHATFEARGRDQGNTLPIPRPPRTRLAVAPSLVTPAPSRTSITSAYTRCVRTCACVHGISQACACIPDISPRGRASPYWTTKASSSLCAFSTQEAGRSQVCV